MLECNRRRWHAWTIAAVFVAAGCGGKSGTTGDVGDAGDLAEAGEAGDAGAVTSDVDAADGFAPGDADGSSNARVVTRLTQNKVTKIDLLFMIDNSSSMADKQAILAQAVPDLVTRLVDPICINPTTGQQTGIRQSDGSCAVGEPDFDPVKDIHIGIITSSLGSHGATGVCDDALDLQRGRAFPHNDDKAHLVARAIVNGTEALVPTFMAQGFLNWNPLNIMGQTPTSIANPFATMVIGVGQHGCGYEASLEAVYRFLIDPDPYQTVRANVVDSPPYGIAELVGTDTVLLKQRADFLRPDSLVAVVMITDENDCSVNDVGQGFYSLIPASGSPPSSILGHGTTACLTNPNDKCCVNCFQDVPAGCPDNKAADPECQAGAWTRDKDPENLRCWNQKKRYGVDFLYPITRYVNGFRSNKVLDRDGRATNNPLFDDLSPSCRVTRQGCAGARDRNLIFVAGIVGVPWQDIAVDPQDLTKGYMTAAQLADQNIWSKIVGDPTASPPIPPTDPHMIESIEPRPGLPPPGSAWNADPISGHEWNVAAATPSPNADLQLACIFPLNPPKICTEAADCDCFATNPAASQNPLCQGTAGAYSTVQTRAKAYPGTRQLQFLQGIGEQGIVASICPANTTNTAGVDYGYRPAIAALVNRIRKPLRGQCLPRKIPVADDGAIPCKIIEAFNPAPGEACTCTSPGRWPVNPQELTPELKAEGACFCEIVQLTGADKAICETSVAPPGNVGSGWCYVDPSQAASPAVAQSQCQLVNSCPPENRRIVRFVNPDSEPRSGANAYLVCDPAAPSTGPAVDPCP